MFHLRRGAIFLTERAYYKLVVLHTEWYCASKTLTARHFPNSKANIRLTKKCTVTREKSTRVVGHQGFNNSRDMERERGNPNAVDGQARFGKSAASVRGVYKRATGPGIVTRTVTVPLYCTGSKLGTTFHLIICQTTTQHHIRVIRARARVQFHQKV